MTTAIADSAAFCTLLEEELGLHITPEDLDRPLDEVPEWDSVHLLRLVTVVESLTGRSVPVTGLLEAVTFREMYDVVVRT
ncbi:MULTISPECIES: acyl carrier protein [unclassified Streptomyces]|uniref:acyl carrier protein n=1 Tax=unclassified Streptomyces TaxID=2593676 RepID=UPI002DD8A13B|nr:acyl carrier protein [Streptomyces sp. NBC_01750]WSB04713.1 acyl carrier protein [Streptomyces sp. NBC_01794]WSD31007.1 acyl carrier protein [Streptomyces sp. NBC_01750]